MRSLSALVALALAFGAAAVPSTAVHKVKENVVSPRGWTKRAPAPSDHIIELRIALPQPKFDVLEKHLYEVSDPFHERYGQHLTKEEVEALVAPEAESIHLVNEWLASHGIYEDDLARSPAKDWVHIKVPVSLAEEMLKTEYHIWTHDASGDSVIRTTSYSLPEHLHEHVELIQPTTVFSRTKSLKTSFRFSEAQEKSVAIAANAPPISVPSASGGHVDASCNQTITVTCILELYNAVGFKASATNGNQIGITGYLEQFANIQDLQTFFAEQRPDALNSTFKTILINGGENNQTLDEAGAEANLDTQFAYGLTFPTPATFYSTGGSPPFIPDVLTPDDSNEPYTEWLDFVLKQKTLPQTISTSYADDEQTVPVSFAKRVCAGFAQLGARGVSLTFSSGDGGVGDGEEDPALQECFTNDGRNVTRFVPLFPPSCPFVTAVGGTIHVPETAVFFSGGGFSDVFPRPAYQQLAVSKFLNKLAPGTYAGLFNPNGRAIPDVAAQADLFRIFLSGRPVSIGGTSAAAPTFASIVSLLNSARISKGLPSLGFLNPLIYALQATDPSVFNDITTGNNPGCGTPGFNATEGWDPVTGVGTPNFGKLKDIVTFDFADVLTNAAKLGA
ncbi:tripeptidyl peptidase A [Dichomitus squalens]|uniref:tripeptidyl-peptidase II n=2 Tax=Dichomitus squalens TaxID=114155 RepID=A0A4Q9M8C8_9APHY|nr:tripeptidyl peptidase A [Dichomitus squalens LYAD-421 SS1]EJF62249.1 tripeptidyl peptidase A [Dichomitus squalens LYAD-421 SS1]TBU22132.1 tripeptidyl peptidase A [Dichomitus squalens]TBU46415.1 tripeptidyl peptidase A [Dichomitus squalens]TBU63321.1 tripeptidyl peptidase A [Dichomitus squalens]